MLQDFIHEQAAATRLGFQNDEIVLLRLSYGCVFSTHVRQIDDRDTSIRIAVRALVLHPLDISPTQLDAVDDAVTGDSDDVGAGANEENVDRLRVLRHLHHQMTARIRDQVTTTDTLESQNSYGALLTALGQHIEAIELYNDALGKASRVLGDNNVLTLLVTNNLAQAQAWAVLPVAGSARLSLDQWQAVLKAACLSEVLADHADIPRDDGVRMKVLLAISGVNLPHDPALTELIAFRGIRAELLEDADALQKIFSVVDVLELHDADQAARTANELLRVPAKEFADLVDEAAARSVRLMNELGLMDEMDADWSERLWVQQQVSMLANLFTEGRDQGSLYNAHCFITRSLFGSIPFCFTIDAEAHYLLPMDRNGLRIALASTSGRWRRFRRRRATSGGCWAPRRSTSCWPTATVRHRASCQGAAPKSIGRSRPVNRAGGRRRG